MKLNDQSLSCNRKWKFLKVELPKFDREKIKRQTKNTPGWVHFGPGNIFRSFTAPLQQTLLNLGKCNYGIIAVAPNNREIIDKIYHPHDNLSLLVTINPDQTQYRKIIGSIVESLSFDRLDKNDWKRLEEIIVASSLQIISFTITEKGYKLYDSNGKYKEIIKQDIIAGPEKTKSFMGKIVSLLYERYINGKLPVTLLSLDNCSHNGIVLKTSVIDIAKKWESAGVIKEGFVQYICGNISFPCTMIDKITPRPSEKVQKLLENEGLEDMKFICSKYGGVYAPFVNAEKFEYLVIEDIFANSRPPLEDAGVIFTDKRTVDKVERMKVCTCLNPLHTTLAIFGCLLGYTLISDEMKDIKLKKLVEKIGIEEGMKVVTDPGIISPKAFIEECLEERFPNPSIPDTPQRIACDTSQKIGIRFGETIKEYINSPDLNVQNLVYIPLVLAGWCRYLLGIDDNGKSFKISQDPMLDKLQKYLSGVVLGKSFDVHEKLSSILSDHNIFGVNLYDVGIGYKVEQFFLEFTTNTGAVKNVLNKYLK